MGAEQATNTSAKAPNESAVIVLKNTSPAQIMFSLNLVSIENFIDAKIPAWKRTPEFNKDTRTDNILPDGIDIVAPHEADNALIVYGTGEAISKLKSIISVLDVEQKKISVKFTIVDVPTDQIKKLGIDWGKVNESKTNDDQAPTMVGFATNGLAKSLMEELTKGGGKIINSPILSTQNNMPAAISVGAQFDGKNLSDQLFVLPRINADGTVTLTIRCTMIDNPVNQKDQPRSQSIYTRRRIMDGETIVIGGFISGDYERLIFITPTVIK